LALPISENNIILIMDIKEQFEQEFTRLVYNLKAINERWITIHPHGEDSEDYRRLKIEDGETPKEAIERVFKKDDKKEKGKKPSLSIIERIEQKRADSDYAYAKMQEVYREISKFKRKLDDLIGNITDNEEIRKIVDKFREENKEEEQQLIKKKDIADKEFQKKEEEFKEFKSQLADEIANRIVDKYVDVIGELVDNLEKLL
jgi:predicted RNase H-like nuclease (RuvC/YqgF family)